MLDSKAALLGRGYRAALDLRGKWAGVQNRILAVRQFKET